MRKRRVAAWLGPSSRGLEGEGIVGPGETADRMLEEGRGERLVQVVGDKKGDIIPSEPLNTTAPPVLS